MDLVSEVLRIIRFRDGIFFDTHNAAPWSISSPAAPELAKLLKTKAECVTIFHFVSEGKFLYLLDSCKPFEADAGNLVIFPHCNAHVICSDQETSPKPLVSLLHCDDNDTITEINHGGNGVKSRFILGILQCDQKLNPLIGALPKVMIVSPTHNKLWEHAAEHNISLLPNMIPRKFGDWLDHTIHHLVLLASSKEPGNFSIMMRISEVLFLEILRQYIQKIPKQTKGWLAGVKDSQVGKALRLLHAKPNHHWQVQELAEAVGLSRSSLAQRFTEFVGEPPISYLTNWRMLLAKNLLLQPNQSIASIAAQVGYDSDVAFTRAFKRYKGEPPVHWRNQVLK